MTVELSLWNRKNSAWREINDSATVAWDSTTNRDTSTASVVDGSVTLAKLANMNTDRLLGRDTASSGPPEEIALSTGLTFTGGPGIALADTAVTPASYTNGTFTVDQQGRITAASSGTAPGMTLLTSGTITTVATVDFVLTSYSTYRTILIHLYGVRPATDDVQLFMRFSTDGGSNYDAGSTDYIYGVDSIAQSQSSFPDGSTGANHIGISTDDASNKLSSDSGAGFDASIWLMNRTDGTQKTRVFFQTVLVNTGPGVTTSYGGGMRASAQDTDAVRFLTSSGNLVSGSYALYGLK